jgi:hypothetical protein
MIAALALGVLLRLSGDPEVKLLLGVRPVALGPSEREDVARRARDLIVGCAIDSAGSPGIFGSRPLEEEWQALQRGPHLYVRFSEVQKTRRGRLVSEMIVGFGAATLAGPELSRHEGAVLGHVKCDGHRVLALMCAPAVRPHLTAGQARSCEIFDRIGEPEQSGQREP